MELSSNKDRFALLQIGSHTIDKNVEDQLKGLAKQAKAAKCSLHLMTSSQLVFDTLKRTHPDLSVLFDFTGAIALNQDLSKPWSYLISGGTLSSEPQRGQLDSANSEKLPCGLAAVTTQNLSTASIPVKTSDFSFDHDILPAFGQSCLNCHAKIGDLHLFDSIESIRNWRATILHNLSMAYMPIGLAGSSGFTTQEQFQYEDLQKVTRWVFDGAPADQEAEQNYINHFNNLRSLEQKKLASLGPPDLELLAPESVSVPDSGRNVAKFFTFKVELSKPEFIEAVFLESNPLASHHKRLYFSKKPFLKKDRFPTSLKVDVQKLNALWGTRRVKGFSMDNSYQLIEVPGLNGFAPLAPCTENDCARPLLPGSGFLTLELHYVPTGKAETDRPKLKIYFAKKPRQNVRKLALGMAPASFAPKPTPGPMLASLDRKMEGAGKLIGFNVNCHNASPHRLRSARLLIRRRQEKEFKAVFVIPNYQYRLQYQNFFTSPLTVEKGDVLRSEFFYAPSLNKESGYGARQAPIDPLNLLDFDVHFLTLFFKDEGISI